MLQRRFSVAALATVLLALVACAISIVDLRDWWDHQSLTASTVSSLLVLAVARLIVVRRRPARHADAPRGTWRQMRQVHSSPGPLVARLPAEYRSSVKEARSTANT